jgi:hypothetical protein
MLASVEPPPEPVLPSVEIVPASDGEALGRQTDFLVV